LLLVASILPSSCAPAKNGISTKSELDTILEHVLKYDRVTGFSVSVFTKDQVLYQNAFGYADNESKTPYTTTTRQLIASISKTTIAVALLKAQELKLLQLDDPINDHLPFTVANPYFKGNPITIRQLAMHTSSIKYSEEMTDFRSFENPDLDLGGFMEAYLAKHGKWYNAFNFHKKKPGSLGDYSNVGASLAAYIIEYTSGMSFSEFTQKYIFEPLEFTHTGFNDATSTQYYKYVSQGNFEKTSMKEAGEGLYPSGGLSTTINELTRFCQMVMNKGEFDTTQVLKPESIDEMLTVTKLNGLDDEIHKQGVFWSTLKNPLGIPNEMIGHNGGDYGIYTMMFFDQKSGIGYILLCNTGMNEENHVSMVSIYKNLWRFSRGIKK